MIAVGIDVSKSKSMVAVLDSYGTVLASPYTVNHDATDMNAFVTNDELLVIKDKKIDVKSLYKKLGSDVTDYHRASVI